MTSPDTDNPIGSMIGTLSKIEGVSVYTWSSSEVLFFLDAIICLYTIFDLAELVYLSAGFFPRIDLESGLVRFSLGGSIEEKF